MALPGPQPVELHEHAMDNLRYIRQTLERAGSFTAVPGKGGVLMGLVALAAERFAARQPSAGKWIAVWAVAALVAMSIGIVGAAVLSGGWASVRIVPMMGACFMLVGTLALLVPGYNDELLAGGFGGLHVVFGTVIAVKYGG